MADYYPLIARAVDGMDESTPQTRGAVYERARTALMQQLRSLEPPLSEEDIERERLSLDDAIARVEADHHPLPAEPRPPPSFDPADKPPAADRPHDAPAREETGPEPVQAFDRFQP